jgi:HD-like signal output (HDOD) protein
LAQLPPFNPVVISLLRLFDRDDAELSEISRLISSDAALSAELLIMVSARDKVLQRLPEIERLVCDEVESLDF